ncbi:hypothetical protein GZ78_00765 [Endozoicomonas numazuensis]|uniref:Uncharacterized protein n=1 Tax=Endozoicomonas numazuensis TaxID=1137799 RepID=A0A081NJR3_9GAMM|nr:hypothetical protein GZ78_00765 [Endozoicomonas numazuensis]
MLRAAIVRSVSLVINSLLLSASIGWHKKNNEPTIGEDEQPLLVGGLISNEEESFTVMLTGSEWIQLVQQYGISRSGIVACLRGAGKVRV